MPAGQLDKTPYRSQAKLRRYRPWAWLTLLVLTIIWTWIAGKELSWDVLNHHLYIPHAWLNNRISADLFGAGPQIYQNPLGYIPFYTMVSADWPSWSIGLTFALLHAINGIFIWLICERVWVAAGNASLKWIALATMLALTAPPFLQAVGTSSIDPTASSFVVAGLWMALEAPHRTRAHLWCISSAAAIGVAFSIKQNNAVFVIALACMAIWQCASGQLRWLSIFSYAAGGLAAIVVGMGWYSLILWNEFGSPLFPLFNHIFHSPYAPYEPLAATRFIPENLSEWLSRPYDMAWPRAYIYTELFSPDIRVLFIATLGLGAAAAYGIRNIRRNKPRPWGEADFTPIDANLLVFCTASYFLWLATSGNGRYAIPLLLVFGILAARWAHLVLGASAGRIAVLCALIVQSTIFIISADWHSNSERWDSQPYYPVKIAPELQQQPYMHITIGAQTMASLLTTLDNRGVLSNPVGQMSIPKSGPLGARFQSLRSRWT
ncbi:ArnT family glycosyltransferase, partial [Luteimonas dalianensis]